MKFARTLAIPASFVLVASAIVACGDDGATTTGSNTTSSSSSSGTGGNGGGGEGGAGEGGAGEGGAGGGPSGQAQVRIAHLSPDAPNVDVCVADAGGVFTGPILKALQVAVGLGYTQVTSYTPVPAGTYTFRVVAPNAADCTTGLLPDVTGIAVEGGAAYTVAAMGQFAAAGTDKPLEIKAFKDELTVEMGKGRLRFVHASADAPNVDVGLVSNVGVFTPVFENVAYGASPSLDTTPLPNVIVGVRATGATDVALTVPGVSLAAGEIITAFAIGNVDNDPKPLKALFCIDSANTNGALADCTAVP